MDVKVSVVKEKEQLTTPQWPQIATSSSAFAE
jgi:hypothetical protein